MIHFVLCILSSRFAPTVATDEFRVVERIKRKCIYFVTWLRIINLFVSAHGCYLILHISSGLEKIEMSKSKLHFQLEERRRERRRECVLRIHPVRKCSIQQLY